MFKKHFFKAKHFFLCIISSFTETRQEYAQLISLKELLSLGILHFFLTIVIAAFCDYIHKFLEVCLVGCLQSPKGPYYVIVPNVLKVSPIVYIAKPKEVPFVHTVWNSVGSHFMQGWISGGPSQDCGHCKPGSLNKCVDIVVNPGTHGLLQEVSQRVCHKHGIHG